MLWPTKQRCVYCNSPIDNSNWPLDIDTGDAGSAHSNRKGDEEAGEGDSLRVIGTVCKVLSQCTTGHQHSDGVTVVLVVCVQNCSKSVYFE